jgi:hypothetical protein
MKIRRFLFGITVLSISVLTTTLDTQARDQLRVQRGQRTRNDSFMHKVVLRPTSTQTGSRVHAVSLSKSEFARLVKAAIKRCGCASPVQDTEFSRGCISGCLRSHGVSTQTAAACAATCAVNLVGCAICAGVGEWIALGCLQYCVWRDVFSYVDGLEASNRGRPSKRGHAKSLMRSPGSASSS